MNTENFPIDLSALKPLALNPANNRLSDEQRKALDHNIRLCRDAIIFFTGVADARGLGRGVHRPGVHRRRGAHCADLLR